MEKKTPVVAEHNPATYILYFSPYLDVVNNGQPLPLPEQAGVLPPLISHCELNKPRSSVLIGIHRFYRFERNLARGLRCCAFFQAIGRRNGRLTVGQESIRLHQPVISVNSRSRVAEEFNFALVQ